MLYKLHNNILIIGLLTIGILAALSSGRALSEVTPVTLFAYITQLSLLFWFSKSEDNTLFSEKTLFITVLVYGFILGAIISFVFYFCRDKTIQFDDPDALFYFVEGVKSDDYGFLKNAKRIITLYDADDWSALLFSAFLMSIIPSSFFMNVIHVLTGAISSVMLYRMGQHFMPKNYAYLASLAYGTSSYLILFHSTYLKESVFTFFVIASMYYFYRSVADGMHKSLFGVAICLLVITFYRPAVTAFLVMSFVSYYAVAKRGSAISFFLYLTMALGLAISVAFLQSQVDTYTAGGNEAALLEENGSANYSGGFNYFVAWFSSLFGPFPTLFPVESTGLVPMNFYGAGLTYKLFLIFPMWLGVFWAVKRFNVLMIPLVIFFLIEMAAAAYVLASFELRKIILHVPCTFILSFYGLSLLEKDKNKISEGFMHLLRIAIYTFPIGVLILWNLIRVK